MSHPIAHPGPIEEVAANQSSHVWAYGDDDRCVICDSRRGSISADYRCGASVPRVGEPVFEDEPVTKRTDVLDRLMWIVRDLNDAGDDAGKDVDALGLLVTFEPFWEAAEAIDRFLDRPSPLGRPREIRAADMLLVAVLVQRGLSVRHAVASVAHPATWERLRASATLAASRAGHDQQWRLSESPPSRSQYVRMRRQCGETMQGIESAGGKPIDEIADLLIVALREFI